MPDVPSKLPARDDCSYVCGRVDQYLHHPEFSAHSSIGAAEPPLPKLASQAPSRNLPVVGQGMSGGVRIAKRHLISSETQLTHGVIHFTFCCRFQFQLGEGPTCDDSGWGPQIRPGRVRGGVAKSPTSACHPGCPGRLSRGGKQKAT